MRRAIPALLAAMAVLVAGCGGTPTAEQKSREAFFTKTKDLTDQEMARLCPSLYPSDFLSTSDPDGPKKYNYTRDKTPDKLSAADLAAAKAMGCTKQGTKPKP